MKELQLTTEIKEMKNVFGKKGYNIHVKVTKQTHFYNSFSSSDPQRPKRFTCPITGYLLISALVMEGPRANLLYVIGRAKGKTESIGSFQKSLKDCLIIRQKILIAVKSYNEFHKDKG